MKIKDLRQTVSPKEVGQDLHALVTLLYPICRSMTGPGVRDTLEILKSYLPLTVHEVPTGTPVFDWTVPREWTIRDAYIKDSSGRRIVDFRESNLHVMSYSTPIHRHMSLGELRPHLHTLPDHPDWIPYRTSHYKDNWGFCLSHRVYERLQEGEYEVCIDSSLTDGTLTYGEHLMEGERAEEILISCHICHPSLCNDNLSGIAIAALLARHLAAIDRRYSYRFLFIPGTIGSITWLSRNEDMVDRIAHGLVLTCVGDPGPFTYKRSRRGLAEIDRAAVQVLTHQGRPHNIIDFFPYGYDERQYCSPGFNLPVGCLMRTPHGQFPQYHTSADDLNFVTPEALGDSFAALLQIIQVLEENRVYLNTNPKCEPQLGRRGLYKSVGGQAEGALNEMALLWVLNQSDGSRSLLDIAERSGMAWDALARAAGALAEQGLLKESAAAAEPVLDGESQWKGTSL